MRLTFDSRALSNDWNNGTVDKPMKKEKTTMLDRIQLQNKPFFFHSFASCTLTHGQGKPMALLNKACELASHVAASRNKDRLTCQNLQQFPPPFHIFSKPRFVWGDPGGVEQTGFAK